MISPTIAKEKRRTWARITVKIESTKYAGPEEIRMEAVFKKISTGIRMIVDGISISKSGLTKTENHETQGKIPNTTTHKEPPAK